MSDENDDVFDRIVRVADIAARATVTPDTGASDVADAVSREVARIREEVEEERPERPLPWRLWLPAGLQLADA